MPADKRYKVEGYWDCQYCGTKGIRGRFKHCPNCGRARDASVRFYTKDIGKDQAISEEEFDREREEARLNSRSSSVEHGGVENAEPGSVSLFDLEEGDGRADLGVDPETGKPRDASDWLCEFCGSFNPEELDICSSCGAPRTDIDGSTAKTYAEIAGVTARTYDAHGNLISERDLSKKRDEASQPHTQKAKGGIWRLVVIAAAVLAAFAVIGMLLSPRPKELTVEGFSWERSIDIDSFQTVQDADWFLPDGARLIRSAMEVKDYVQILDHYESQFYEVAEKVFDHYDTYTTTVDNGDGTFDVEEHSVPVYRTEYRTEERQIPIYRSEPIIERRYYYEIERWIYERSVETSGNDHDPKWGEVVLAEGSGEYRVGAEREGDYHGKYSVAMSDGKTYTADEDFWDMLELGEKVEVYTKDGHITPVY